MGTVGLRVVRGAGGCEAHPAKELLRRGGPEHGEPEAVAGDGVLALRRLHARRAQPLEPPPILLVCLQPAPRPASWTLSWQSTRRPALRDVQGHSVSIRPPVRLPDVHAPNAMQDMLSRLSRATPIWQRQVRDQERSSPTKTYLHTVEQGCLDSRSC